VLGVVVGMSVFVVVVAGWWLVCVVLWCGVGGVFIVFMVVEFIGVLGGGFMWFIGVGGMFVFCWVWFWCEGLFVVFLFLGVFGGVVVLGFYMCCVLCVFVVLFAVGLVLVWGWCGGCYFYFVFFFLVHPPPTPPHSPFSPPPTASPSPFHPPPPTLPSRPVLSPLSFSVLLLNREVT